MSARGFDLELFYVHVAATSKERSPLRQDLVRGLKDWYIHIYGYDRYGAETAFLVSQRMGEPHIYGYGLLRILHDRRVSNATKTAAARRALEAAEYDAELGPPFGLMAALHFLTLSDAITIEGIRYGLVLTAGQDMPFAGVDKAIATNFLRILLYRDDMATEERAFWGHSLLVRHHDSAGIADMINLLLSCDAIPASQRRELCWAWVHHRQPRIDVPTTPSGDDPWSRFVADHMPFWTAHVRSWPGLQMTRLGLVWLVRLGEDPLAIAQAFLSANTHSSDQIHAGVADIIAEHHTAMPASAIVALLEQGIGVSSSAPTRRRFYRLGADLLGPQYLHRATSDSAGSVRQWAIRRLQDGPGSSAPSEGLALPSSLRD